MIGRTLFVGIAAAGIWLSALVSTRRGRLSYRYLVGWFSFGVILIVGALFGSVIESIAPLFGVEPYTVIAGAVIAVIAVIGLQLSIAVSELRSRTRLLAEHHSILTQQVHSAMQMGDRGAADAGICRVEPPEIDGGD